MSEQADIAPAAEFGPRRAGPGTRLRTAREQRGLALGAVAESLHVAPRMVAAMEADDFAAFDAPVYAKGFLRKYAAVLGVPTDEVLAAYDALASGPTQPTLIPAMNVAAPKPALSTLSLAPAPALVIAALVVVVGGGYWLWSARPRSAPAAVPLADSPVSGERDGVAVAGALPLTQPPARGEEPAVAATPAAETRARAADAAPAPLRAPLPATTAAAAQHHGAARVDALLIQADGECWTEVYAPNGTRLLYDLMHTGESRSVAGPGPWKVVLGAADGAHLAVGERAVAVPPPRRGATTAIFVVGRDGAVH